jgi:hypothetical protein
MPCSKKAFSFNQLIGTVEQLRWNGKTKQPKVQRFIVPPAELWSIL